MRSPIGTGSARSRRTSGSRVGCRSRRRRRRRRRRSCRQSFSVVATQDADARAEVARLAAAGAWNLGQWDAFESYSKSLRKDTLETDFFCAVLDVNCGRAPAPAPASSMHSHPRLARLGEYLGEQSLPQPLRRGKSADRRGEDEVGLGADCAGGRELPPRVQGGGPGELSATFSAHDSAHISAMSDHRCSSCLSWRRSFCRRRSRRRCRWVCSSTCGGRGCAACRRMRRCRPQKSAARTSPHLVAEKASTW